MQGKVYLVGMGPGDPDLATLKSIKIIEACDVLVYDRLVNPVFLEYNKKAEKIYVGKASREHTKTQDEINELLAVKAKEGLIVGRLKGGDPFVFGRGGEEALYLREQGVDYEVVPGITSSIAVPAYAGIPVTQRGIATSFHVITGHEYGEISKIEWDALAKLRGTLVFLMGVENLELITGNLIKMGKDKDCPAAVVMNGTRPDQREVFGTLESISAVCRADGIKSPAVIVIGEVVGLHDAIDWRQNKPLSNLKVVLTRPYEKSNGLKEELTSLGALVQVLPCIRITPVSFELSKEAVECCDAFIFSSSFGVRYFMEQLKSQSIDLRSIKGGLYGVGASIKEELEAYGVFGCILPDKQNAEEVAQLVKRDVRASSKVMLISGNLGGDRLAEKLDLYQVNTVRVYETLEGCEDEACVDAEAIIFTSPSCVRGFLKRNNIDAFKGKLALCIGATTREEAVKAGFVNAWIPENSSEQELVQWLINWRMKNA